MHGGNAPPIVVPATSSLGLTVHPGFGGFSIELDGHAHPLTALAYCVSLRQDELTVVSLGEPGPGIAALRSRRLIIDSPRVLARDIRAGARA